MPRMSDLFSGKSLKAADLQGKRILVTISGGEMVDFGDDGNKWSVKFAGKDKGLILNKTNASMIEEITGSDDTDDWVGKKIVLYPTKTDYSGKRVDCIRVDYPPDAKRPEPPPTVDEIDDSEVPF